MYCKKCGKELAENAAFCKYCGASANEKDADETTVLDSDETSVLTQKGTAVLPSDAFVQPTQLPPVPQKKKKNKGVIIAVVLAAVLVLSGIGRAAERAAQKKKNTEITDAYSFEADMPIAFGDIKNGAYENEYLKIRIVPPSDKWEYMSKEEIRKSYADNADARFDSATNETYISDLAGKTYYDMFMYDVDTNANVQVMILEVNEGCELSIDDYFDVLENEYSKNFGEYTFENTGSCVAGGRYYVIKTLRTTFLGKEITQMCAVTRIGKDITMICATVTPNDNDFNFFSIINDLT